MTIAARIGTSVAPFTYAVTTDPVSKVRDGLSKKPATDPLVFQTDTESEFWEMKDSLNVVATRMASRDVEQLALVAQLQREAGGDAAEVIDTVAATVRERFDLKRLIQTLTMSGALSLGTTVAPPLTDSRPAL